MPRLRSRDQLIPRVSAPHKQVAASKRHDRGCRAARRHPENRIPTRADERGRGAGSDGAEFEKTLREGADAGTKGRPDRVRIYRDRGAR
ncbi:hypothetical protein X777_07414 [Ooceraea biroi]|uniref:Uncharacterized protein n=1 Tax=Ooceraea biroi TaxID=2015173 RepID=A0A026WD23_OOCBI|nr:hypothetical protein X777_07414 [Ooceraea biroi]